jgi:hypothetical protein
MTFDAVAGAVGFGVGLWVGALAGFFAGRRGGGGATTLPVPVDTPAPVSARVSPPPPPASRAAEAGRGGDAARAFDQAVEEAVAMGWSPRLAAGADLERSLDEGDEGARRFVLALEGAARRGIAGLDDAFARQLAVARVWEAAAALVATRGLELVVEAPRAVGPPHQERWLVDEDLVRRLGTGRPGGFVQPVLVLRPALLRGDVVLLEGVVV